MRKLIKTNKARQVSLRNEITFINNAYNSGVITKDEMKEIKMRTKSENFFIWCWLTSLIALFEKKYLILFIYNALNNFSCLHNDTINI